MIMATVHVIDNFSTGKKENCNPKAIYHEYDISDFSISNELIEIMENCDGLFHTAALARVQQSIENPIKYETVNTFGTLNILKCAADAKLRRVVYSASSSAYGNKKEMPCKETDQVNPFLLMLIKNIMVKYRLKCLQNYLILRQFL